MSLAAGMALKDAGQNQVESNAQVFVETMRSHARILARQNGSVTSDDLRDYADEIGLYPHHQNAWGCLFRGDDWMQIGYVKSRRRSNRARVIGVWALRS